jgi:transposase-like protein
MTDIYCKKCGSVSCVKNGFMSGLQRYRCKDCRYNFTLTKARGKPPGVKALAILLYGFAGVTMAKIARIVGVSEVAVYKWIRAAGEAAQRPSNEDAEIVMIDEMWHYVDGKKRKFGSGKPMTLYGVKSLPGIWVAVTTEASKSSLPK